MKKSLLFALCALLLPIVANAYNFSVDGIYYNKNSDGTSVTVTYKTTSDRGYSGSVVIPSTVTYNDTEYSVTSIGGEAFYNCRGLTSVTIPNSVTSIGYYAFYNCTGLTSVTIGNSVTSIGTSAFSGCSGLTSINIGNSVTSIGNYAFSSCFGLTSITIPNSVTSIGNYAFRGCSGLTSVTIPNSVTSIGEYAFYNCSGLTSVTIGNSVMRIRSYVFDGCPLQTIVNRGNNNIESEAFSARTFLHAQLYVPEGTVWNYIYNTKWGEFHNIREFANNADNIRNNAVYLIADHSGRNFPVFDKATKSLKNVAYTLNLDDNDAGACWRIVKDGSDTYLYNIGAGMYASYDLDNNLALSIVPSAVNIDVTEDGTTINGRPVMLVVNKSLTPVGPEYILGDANGNGEVEIGDVTSVLTLMATPEATGYNNKAADANENGEIEIGDVTTILTIMANGE